MENNIKQLFLSAENKSNKLEKYFDVYDKLFSKYKNKDIIFVEIGVHNGGSLEIWQKYFTVNSRIIGIDLNPECKKFEKENIEIYIGNQSDENFWNDFFSKVGNVDIILDDGGHTNLDQITTTVNVIDKINDGGTLLIEDTITSYIKEYNSNKKFSFINFSKKLIDDINSKSNKSDNNFKFSLNNYIYSLQFFEGMVAFYIDRSKCKNNQLISNDGKDDKIQDLTWKGNEINILRIKNLLKKIPFIRLNKLTKIIKNKINNDKIKNFFK